MTFKEGLINARSHIMFVFGLLVTFSIIIYLERLNASIYGPSQRIEIEKKYEVPLAESGYLTSEEFRAAQIAWRYFENNFQFSTGLVNSVDGYPSTT
ncbi:MAG: DUF3131 domain-containing protein, partial [Pseudomonadota bacterium]